MNTNRTVSCRATAATRWTKARALYWSLCALGIAVAASAGEGSPQFITFDAPGAGAIPGAYQGTGCLNFIDCSVVLNKHGAITGYYLAANNVYHGFVRSPEGEFTTFDAPGADTTPGSFNGTDPYAINDLGVITGAYSDVNGVHGFLRSPEGAFTTFDVPGGSLLTIPVALNLEGSVVGSVLDQNAVWHAFLRKRDGTFKTFSAPGGCDTSFSTSGCTGTGALSINVSGTISGGYADNNLVLHGLVRSPEGKLTTFDAPGAGAVPGSYQGTSCVDCAAPLNQFGVIAGYYIDANYVVHGFLRSPRGEIRTFDAPPDAGSFGFGCSGACPLGLNDSGAITGSYQDANNVWHGFVRSPEGKFTTFDAPGADNTPGLGNGTFPVSINEQGAIAGFYLDKNEVNHGFLRLPAEDD